LQLNPSAATQAIPPEPHVLFSQRFDIDIAAEPPVKSDSADW